MKEECRHNGEVSRELELESVRSRVEIGCAAIHLLLTWWRRSASAPPPPADDKKPPDEGRLSSVVRRQILPYIYLIFQVTTRSSIRFVIAETPS